MPRYMFHDIAGRSGHDPSLHLGNMGIALASGRSTGGKADDDYTEDTIAGEHLPVTGTNLTKQARRSGVDPTLPDTDSGTTYKPRDVPEPDLDPPMTGTGTNQKQGNPNGSRELVASFNTQGSRFNYFVGEPSPGTWTLMRRDARDGNSKPAEVVQRFSTGGQRYYYHLVRTGNIARVYRSDRQQIDPNYKQVIGETAPSPSTADRRHADAREAHTVDSLQRINEANRAYYKQGGVPRRKPGASR